MEKKIFLLGGHDLEMLEIANLLKCHNILFFDRNLSWNNADLSAYQDVLQMYENHQEVQIYGVELYNDLGEMPGIHYFRVDHHNDYNGRPSALEQTAQILGVELTRQQQLIAANDAGYIPAMQSLGASPAEIAEIRLADRKMQGCTAQDEQMAEQALKENCEDRGDLIVVRALSSRFSPICDRLWPYRKLLIYTDGTLCYYGIGKESLVEYFRSELASGKMYHGGGENGFLGVVEGIYTSEEIRHYLQVIENVVIQ